MPAMAVRDDVFRSIFPPTMHTTPTPEATPTIGTLTSPAAPFGGFHLPDAIDVAAKHNRAWSSATRFLAIPPGLHSRTEDLEELPEVQQAFRFLLSSHALLKSLCDWYAHEVATHFRRFVLPELEAWQNPTPVVEVSGVLSHTVSILRQARQLYLDFGSSANDALSDFIARVNHDFHVLVIHSLPRQRLHQGLASFLYQMLRNGLSKSSNPERCLKRDRCLCQLQVDPKVLVELHEVGLGGANGERALALAVHMLLRREAVQRRCFQVDWTNKQPVVARLRAWIVGILVPAVEQVVAALTGNRATTLPTEQFMSVAVGSFGRSRISALFDYVSTWPASEGAVLDIREHLNASGTSEKAYLCSSFSEQMQHRLLHAGASTTEILSVYINIISVFQLLDSRGVLLEKVAIPIRSYLRNREDTVTVIATSLLADVDENGEVQSHGQDKICTDITIAVSLSAIDAQEDRHLNWNDMNWVPDPIDAGPTYRSSKSDDVVAYILGLFDADEFIKTVSAAFGDHLLRSTESEFSKEIRLVELLKSRLDATKLQSIEVMLKDVRDSMLLNRRVNPEQHRSGRDTKPTPKDIQAALPDEGITIVSLYDRFKGRINHQEFQAALSLVARRHDDLYFPKRTRPPRGAQEADPDTLEMHFEAKVLSSYFWPQLRDVDFRVPPQAHAFMKKYENAFSNISGQRKLEWKHGLGTTDIVLELEDRTIEEHGVEIWKTSIIDAFASHPPSSDNHGDDEEQEEHQPYDPSRGLSVPELMSLLHMSEEYALSAISFWLSKRVLYEVSPHHYAVLERLDMEIDYAPDQSQLDIEAISAIKSEDAMLRENAPMYQTFIDGMLRNQGAKEIEGMMGITSMLRMVIPGFGGGDAEVLWLLEDMEGQGRVRRSGDLWGVV